MQQALEPRWSKLWTQKLHKTHVKRKRSRCVCPFCKWGASRSGWTTNETKNYGLHYLKIILSITSYLASLFTISPKDEKSDKQKKRKKELQTALPRDLTFYLVSLCTILPKEERSKPTSEIQVLSITLWRTSLPYIEREWEIKGYLQISNGDSTLVTWEHLCPR